MRRSRESTASGEGDSPSRRLLRSPVVPWVGLVLVTLAAFAPALENGLVDWDDRANLLLNDRYQGLSPAHLTWMFTTAHGGHYHPLTWLSFAVDYTLYRGVNAFGVHLTNILLHVLTVLGVAVVIRQLLRAALAEVDGRVLTLMAVLAAAVYAVHPLRVESVAWATERRDVLCGALLVWAIVAYVRAVRPDGPDRGSVDAGIRLDGGTAIVVSPAPLTTHRRRTSGPLAVISSRTARARILGAPQGLLEAAPPPPASDRPCAARR